MQIPTTSSFILHYSNFAHVLQLLSVSKFLFVLSLSSIVATGDLDFSVSRSSSCFATQVTFTTFFSSSALDGPVVSSWILHLLWLQLFEHWDWILFLFFLILKWHTLHSIPVE